MPTSFQNLIRSRVTGRVEENLETGKIYVFTPGTMYTNFCSGFCWNPPGTGRAVIEVWALSEINVQDVDKLLIMWSNLDFSWTSDFRIRIGLNEIREFWLSNSGVSKNLFLTKPFKKD